jgi:hypothetical protein
MTRVLVLGFLLFAPAFAFAASYGTFAELASFIVSLLNGGTALLVVAGVVVYFWGVSTNIFKLQKGDASQWKAHLLWGIGILFVMVSIWGIVALVQDALFGQGAGGSTGGGGAVQRPGGTFNAPAFNE